MDSGTGLMTARSFCQTGGSRPTKSASATTPRIIAATRPCPNAACTSAGIRPPQRTGGRSPAPISAGKPQRVTHTAVMIPVTVNTPSCANPGKLDRISGRKANTVVAAPSDRAGQMRRAAAVGARPLWTRDKRCNG